MAVTALCGTTEAGRLGIKLRLLKCLASFYFFWKTAPRCALLHNIALLSHTGLNTVSLLGSSHGCNLRRLAFKRPLSGLPLPYMSWQLTLPHETTNLSYPLSSTQTLGNPASRPDDRNGPNGRRSNDGKTHGAWPHGRAARIWHGTPARRLRHEWTTWWRDGTASRELWHGRSPGSSG